MMIVWYKSKTGTLTLPEHVSWLPVAQSLGFCVVFCTSLFACLSFFLWPLFCLVFD